MLLCDETQLEYISFSFAFFSVDKEKLGYYLPEGTYTTSKIYMYIDIYEYYFLYLYLQIKYMYRI